LNVIRDVILRVVLRGEKYPVEEDREEESRRKNGTDNIKFTGNRYV
jgi:hypothetical protein